MFSVLDFLRYFPENVSTFGFELDRLFAVIWYITLAIFFLTYGLLVYVLVKYRQKPGVKASGSHGNNMLEFTWTILPTFLFAGLGIYTDNAWEVTKNEQRIPKPDIEIEVLGKQFNWMFRYPGADGVLGKQSPKFRTVDNPFGLDANDPNAVDDIIMENEFHLPINKNILVRLSSVDVLHSFFLPNFRVKQDALPGNWMKVWFNGIKAGKYELACAELCGASHYNMRGVLFMHAQQDYNTWYDAEISKRTQQLAAFAAEGKPPIPKTVNADIGKIVGSHH
jgi:cytochrome c oxidase subunit 2